jgi:putative ABC transport system permease protein
MRILAWLRAAMEEIVANRSRSFLAVLSVVVGVWSVTVVVAAGEVGRAALIRNLERTLGRPATVRVDVTQTPPGMSISALRDRLSGLMMRYATPLSSPVETVVMPVNVNGTSVSLTLKGVGPRLPDVQFVDQLAGRWLTALDEQSLAPMVVPNANALQRLGIDRTGSVVGSSIHLGTLMPVVGRIVGVVGATPQEDAIVYLPVGTLERWGAPPGAGLSLSYLVRVDPSQADALTNLIRLSLGQWGLNSGATVGRVDRADDVNAGLVAVQAVLAAIAGVSLLTGGIGVLNLGLVSVRERVREFGIRRAFGATPTSIFVMVLAEAVITAIAAGAVGVLLAVVTVGLLPGALTSFTGGEPVTESFPLSAALLGFGLSFLVGMVAGIIPARRANRGSVVEAIRQ